MAKLEAHGTELFRFFRAETGQLNAIMTDGVRLFRTPFHGWRVGGRVRADVSLDKWASSWKIIRDNQPEWARSLKSIPTQSTLEKWENDGVCKTPTGHTVEPDGVGPDGVPSWLRILRLI